MKSSTTFSRALPAVLLAFGAMAAGPAAAQQNYPEKPIRLIVPFPPGGTTDALARLVGQKLASSWGQAVIVDNRPGADQIIATDALAKSPPDGYTLMMALNSLGINPHTHRKLPYDTQKDFAPIASIAASQQIFAISGSLPATTLQEFIALAKTKPGQLNHGAPGVGGIVHLTLEQFNNMAGVDVQHIPYKGSAQAMTDLISGQIQVSLAPPLLVQQYISTGKLKALAVTGEHRTPSLPQVPTFAEAGLPGVDMKIWYGLIAPAGTPKNVIQKLSSELARIMALPEAKTFMDTQGFEPFLTNTEQFTAMLKSDDEKYAKIIKTSHIKIED